MGQKQGHKRVKEKKRKRNEHTSYWLRISQETVGQHSKPDLLEKERLFADTASMTSVARANGRSTCTHHSDMNFLIMFNMYIIRK